MLKKIFFILLFALWSVGVQAAGSTSCGSISTTETQVTEADAVIPDSVMENISLNIEKINKTVINIMVIGQALNCHAVYTAKHEITIAGYHLIDYPDIPIWLCGSIIYIMGFMISLSVTFYLVDIGFKLGLAIIFLPIGIALWPFSWTKSKLIIIISMILKSAAIFAFLSLTVTYAYELVNAALADSSILMDNIENNKLDYVANNFTLTSTMFLLCIFALVYGMMLIGNTISDYVDKFFPDKALGSASPIHGSMTQAVDFVKQKAVDPVVSYAKDVAKTQTGHVLKGTGKLMTGQYNTQIRKAAHFVANPSESAGKIVQGVGQGASWITEKGGKALTGMARGTVGRMVMGNNASKNLQNSINAKIEQKAKNINQTMAGVASNVTANLENSWVGRSSAAVRDNLHSAGETISDVTQQTKNSIKNSKAGQAVQVAQSKIDSFVNGADALIQDVENNKQAYFRMVDEPADYFLNKISQKEQAVTSWSKKGKAKIDKLLATNNKDSKFTKGLKATSRFLAKNTINLASTVNLVPHTVAIVSKVAVIGVGAVAKVPARIGSSIEKNLIRVVKSPITITRVVTKIINPKNIWMVTGSVLEKTGDRMTRNKKTATQSRNEALRKKYEQEERDRLERLKKEQEADRL